MQRLIERQLFQLSRDATTAWLAGSALVDEAPLPAWRARCRRFQTWSLLLAAAALLLPPRIVRADPSLAVCNRWQHSTGAEYILLGNAIGAASYLTKVRRFAESSEENPELLYAPADLLRACDGWR